MIYFPFFSEILVVLNLCVVCSFSFSGDVIIIFILVFTFYNININNNNNNNNNTKFIYAIMPLGGYRGAGGTGR